MQFLTFVAWALAMFIAAPLQANAQTQELWINFGGFSSHFDRSKHYNESNAGLGIEYRASEQLSYSVGAFNNSIRQTTNYAAMNWQPFAIGPWKLGAAVGFADGYPGIESGGTFVAALPMATYEGKQFGVNVGIIPTVANINGSLVVQLKARIF